MKNPTDFAYAEAVAFVDGVVLATFAVLPNAADPAREFPLQQVLFVWAQTLHGAVFDEAEAVVREHGIEWRDLDRTMAEGEH